MSVLNAFVDEIENRKVKELSILDSTLSDKRENTEITLKERLSEIKEKYENESRIRSQREFARISESARLQAKKIIFDTINTNMDSTIQLIKDELKGYSKKSEYKKILERMIQYSKKELGDKIIVNCREVDAEFVQNKGVTLGPFISTLGGIIASDIDNVREVDLTFEELLNSHEDEVKNLLLEKMVK